MKFIVTITAKSWFSISFTMEVVHELIYLLDRYSVRHIDVITNPRTAPDKKESRYHDYYVGMRDARWANDAEAAQAFGMEPDSKNWQRFKNEVKKRVANSLLFIEGDEQNMSEYNRMQTLATQHWAVAITCWLRGAKKTYLEFAYKALEIALKYEIVEQAMSITLHLKHSFVSDFTMRKEYERLHKLSLIYFEAFIQEQKAKEAYEELLLPLLNKKGKRKEASLSAFKLYQNLKEFSPLNNFIYFNQLLIEIHMYAFLLNHKWREALHVIDEGKQFIKSKPFFKQGFYLTISLQEIVCHIMIKEHSNIEEKIVELLKLIPEGTYNWFKSHELQAVNYFYSRNYQEAWNTYKLVTKHKLYNINVTPLDKETWRLFYAYLVMLTKYNKIQVSPREKGEVEKFRLSSWINDITMLGLDKRGSNIPVIIFQALYYFLEDRIDEFDGRVDSLTKYRQRNLDTANEHFRTECFAELLELLRDHAHNHKTLMDRSTPVLQQLSSVSTDLLDSSFELEVMPYEHQWEWLMEVYDGRRTGKK